MIPRLISGLTDALVLGVGLICLVAATGAQGGRFNARLDVLTHFAPFWLVGAVVATIYGLALSRPDLRGLTAGAGALGALLSMTLIAPEYLRAMPTAAAADAPRQVRIVQINAWGKNRDIPGTVRWILAQNPDAVVVEEAERPVREALIATGQFHYTRGMLRTAIFSRAAPGKTPFRLGEPWDQWPGIVRAALPGPDGLYTLVGLHLTWPTDPFQASQIRRVTQALTRTDASRLIVVGDFNLTPWSFTLRRLDHDIGLTRRDRAMFTWPAQAFAKQLLTVPAPFLPIDHIYAGSAWRTVKVERGPRLGSDHFPVLVVLALKD